MLFVRHETQISEYNKTGKETGEAVDGRCDQAVATRENTKFMQFYYCTIIILHAHASTGLVRLFIIVF
jgi:hypothetical protein